jgi:hypothetical protein
MPSKSESVINNHLEKSVCCVEYAGVHTPLVSLPVVLGVGTEDPGVRYEF